MSTEKDLNYWKENAEEDYVQVPISVLRYISEVEQTLTDVFDMCMRLQMPTEQELKDLAYKLRCYRHECRGDKV
jgi:hypothetical protein